MGALYLIGGMLLPPVNEIYGANGSEVNADLDKGHLSSDRRSVMDNIKKKLWKRRRGLEAKIARARHGGRSAVAKGYLKELRSLLAENSSVFTDANVKLPELDCRLELVDVWPVRLISNFKTVVQRYRQAATLSTPPSCPELPQKTCGIIDNRGCSLFTLETPYLFAEEGEHRLCVYRIGHHSNALQYEAFNRSYARVSDLRNAVHSMSEAIRLQVAISPFDTLPKRRKRRRHVSYLSYWYHSLSTRLKVSEGDFDGALIEIDKAIQFANQLTPVDSFFPNYFFDPEDVANERLFVEAHKLVAESRFGEATEKLRTWIEKSSVSEDRMEAMRFRYDNISARYHAALLLSKLALGELPAATRAHKDLCELAENAYLGVVSGKLISLLGHILFEYSTRSQLTQERIGQITKLFAFDFDASQIGILPSASRKTEPIDLLPPAVGTYFRPVEAEKVADRRYVDAEWGKYVEGLTSVLLLIAEYNALRYQRDNSVGESHIRPLPEGFDAGFQKMSPHQLITAISVLGRNRGNKSYPNVSKRLFRGAGGVRALDA